MSFIVYVWQFVGELTVWITGGIFLAYLGLESWGIVPAIPPEQEQVLVRIYFFLALLFSSYRVWLKQYRNPVDHKITCEVKKINFDYILEAYEVKDEEIDDAKKTLSQWVEWNKQYSKEQIANLIKSGAPTKEDCEKYLNSLDSYNRKLTAFREEIKNCYFIDAYIHNHGSLMDTKISIGIHASEKSKDKFRFCKHVNDFPLNLPEKPQLRNVGGISANIKKIIWGVYTGEPPKDRWLSHTVLTSHISIEINELKVGTGIHFIYHDAVIKTDEKQIQLEYWISSANTTKRIDGKLNLNLEEAPNKWPI